MDFRPVVVAATDRDPDAAAPASPGAGPPTVTPGSTGRGPMNAITAAVLGAGAALIALSHVWGRWLQDRGHRMAVNAPPLTGNIDVRVGVASLPALAVAAGAVGGADHVARALPWRRLLWASFAAALAWSVTLAASDGLGGFTRSPASPVDYLQALPLVDDVGGFLRRLLTDTTSLPSHVQAHPPGMVVALLGLERLGLATPSWVAAIEHLAGAASVPAVLLVAREVSRERVARAVAPFVAFSTIAVTWSSGDAIFLGVGTWAVALLVLATGAEGRRCDALALCGGLLAAAGIFLSYGLVLVGLVPLVVAWRRRRWRPLVVASLPVLVSVAIAALGGFWWFAGLAATRRAYALSLARVRPYGYFLVANVAALAIAVGPAVWVGLARLRHRGLWMLAGAGLAAIALADVSGLSKAEVERIWLPFMPWLVVAGAAAFADGSATTRRRWLGVQVGTALVVQAIVFSPW